MLRRNNKCLPGTVLLGAVLLQIAATNVVAGEITELELQNHTAGKATYEDNCAACHGYDGIPMLPGTPNFIAGERLERSDEELLLTIAKGREMMPPWEDELTVVQREQVLAYIRGMADE